MHQRLTLRIGFKAERYVPVAVRLHLLGIKGLNIENRIFNLLNHLGAIRPVIRQEVDHPHRARFTDIQIRQPLARRPGMIAPPLLEID